MKKKTSEGVGVIFRMGTIDPLTKEITWKTEETQNLITDWGLGELKKMWFCDATRYAILGTGVTVPKTPITAKQTGNHVVATGTPFEASTDVGKHIAFGNRVYAKITQVNAPNSVTVDTVHNDASSISGYLCNTKITQLTQGVMSTESIADFAGANSNSFDYDEHTQTVNVTNTRAHIFPELTGGDETFLEIGWSPYFENVLDSKVFGIKQIDIPYMNGDVPYVSVTIVRSIDCSSMSRPAGSLNIAGVESATIDSYDVRAYDGVNHSTIETTGLGAGQTVIPTNGKDSLFEGFSGPDRSFICCSNFLDSSGFRSDDSGNTGGVFNPTSVSTITNTELVGSVGGASCPIGITEDSKVVNLDDGSELIQDNWGFDGWDINANSLKAGGNTFYPTLYIFATDVIDSPHILYATPTADAMHGEALAYNTPKVFASDTNTDMSANFDVVGDRVVSVGSANVAVYGVDTKSNRTSAASVVDIIVLKDNWILLLDKTTLNNEHKLYKYKEDTNSLWFNGDSNATTRINAPTSSPLNPDSVAEVVNVATVGSNSVYIGGNKFYSSKYGFVFKFNGTGGEFPFDCVAKYEADTSGSGDSKTEQSRGGLLYLKKDGFLYNTNEHRVIGDFNFTYGAANVLRSGNTTYITTLSGSDTIVQSRDKFEFVDSAYNTTSYFATGGVVNLEPLPTYVHILESTVLRGAGTSSTIVLLVKEGSAYKIYRASRGSDYLVYSTLVLFMTVTLHTSSDRGKVLHGTDGKAICIGASAIYQIPANMSLTSSADHVTTAMTGYTGIPACFLDEGTKYAYTILVAGNSLKSFRLSTSENAPQGVNPITKSIPSSAISVFCNDGGAGNRNAYVQWADGITKAYTLSSTTPVEKSVVTTMPDSGSVIGVGGDYLYYKLTSSVVRIYKADSATGRLDHHSEFNTNSALNADTVFCRGNTIVYKQSDGSGGFEVVERTVLKTGSFVTSTSRPGDITADTNIGFAGSVSKFSITEAVDTVSQTKPVKLLPFKTDVVGKTTDAAMLDLRDLEEENVAVSSIKSIALIAGEITNPTLLWHINIEASVPTEDIVISNFIISHTWGRI